MADRQRPIPPADARPLRPGAANARLFLALWPTPALQRALDAHDRLWAWPAQAARVPQAQWHVTLHFLGGVPRARIPDLLATLATLPPCPAAELRLDRPTLWPGGSAVLLAGDVPPTLHDFHRALGQAVSAAGLPVERRAWKPHVTFARRAVGARPPADSPPLIWPAGPDSGWVLVESVPGGGYQVLRRFSDPAAPVTPAGAAG